MSIAITIAGFYLVFFAMIIEAANFKSIVIFRLTPLVLGVTLLIGKAPYVLKLLGE